MLKRFLGKGQSSLEVSTLGLGCMGMSHQYGKADETDSLAVINRALELGINFLDSSDSYGPFINEELISKVLKTKREQIIIATKFGQQFLSDGTRKINGTPDYVKQACDASLKRLGVETIDLYYQHRVDKSVPVEETWGAMKQLVEEGKVRKLGISEASAETIRKAHSVHPITALQTEYSLWSRDLEKNNVLTTIKELGIGLVAYAPLGRGFLTGAIKDPTDLKENDGRKSWPRFQTEAIQENSKLVDKLSEIANELSCSLNQLAIAWVLAQRDDIVPIPGTTKVKNLESNAKSNEIKLSPEILERLDSISNEIVIVGTRYPEQMMKAVDA
jgi:aryl-alcohol dehydrogenase-like predicted oxidoreductase